jgi:hypothetical protein
MLILLKLKYDLQEEDIRTGVTLFENHLRVRNRDIEAITLLGIFMLFPIAAVLSRFYSQLVKKVRKLNLKCLLCRYIRVQANYEDGLLLSQGSI